MFNYNTITVKFNNTDFRDVLDISEIACHSDEMGFHALVGD